MIWSGRRATRSAASPAPPTRRTAAAASTSQIESGDVSSSTTAVRTAAHASSRVRHQSSWARCGHGAVGRSLPCEGGVARGRAASWRGLCRRSAARVLRERPIERLRGVSTIWRRVLRFARASLDVRGRGLGVGAVSGSGTAPLPTTDAVVTSDAPASVGAAMGSAASGAVAGCGVGGGAGTGAGAGSGGAAGGGAEVGGGVGAGAAAGAGGGLGALRGGSRPSGSTYVSPSPTRIPRWT
jgi:hypothetical protein